MVTYPRLLIVKLIENELKIFQKQQRTWKKNFLKRHVWILVLFYYITFSKSNKKDMLYGLGCVWENIWRKLKGCFNKGRLARIAKHYVLRGTYLSGPNQENTVSVLKCVIIRCFQSIKKWLKHPSNLLLFEILKCLYLPGLHFFLHWAAKNTKYWLTTKNKNQSFWLSRKTPN